MLFYLWEDVRVWAHWNSSFDMHLSSLGPVSCVFSSWALSGLTVRKGYSLMAARWQVLFVSFLSSLRAHQLTCAAISDDCDTVFRYSQQYFIFSASCVCITFSIAKERREQRKGWVKRYVSFLCHHWLKIELATSSAPCTDGNQFLCSITSC